jgi:hypothetical protein
MGMRKKQKSARDSIGLSFAVDVVGKSACFIAIMRTNVNGTLFRLQVKVVT